MDSVELERDESARSRKPRRPEAAPPMRLEPDANKAEPDEPIWLAHW
jgi:hypothetical protein